jgi:hypothetical protein
MNLNKKMAKLNDTMEKLKTDILITETTLEEIVGDI